MQNNVISFRITSLYGSQPSSVVFAYKTAPFGPELQFSMGPRPHLRFFAFKTEPLAPDFQVSMVPALICGFSKQNSDFWIRITSLSGSQTSPVVLCMQNSMISTRNTRLYESHPSSMDFACKTATLGPELQVSMVPRPHLSFCACKTG